MKECIFAGADTQRGHLKVQNFSSQTPVEQPWPGNDQKTKKNPHILMLFAVSTEGAVVSENSDNAPILFVTLQSLFLHFRAQLNEKQGEPKEKGEQMDFCSLRGLQ